MEEKIDNNSEEMMEKMFAKMGNHMVGKLKERIVKIKKRLEEIEKSGKENKENISEKLKELIQVMDKMTEKTELQNKTQTEMFHLMENMGKLDNEIDDLLIKDLI